MRKCFACFLILTVCLCVLTVAHAAPVMPEEQCGFALTDTGRVACVGADLFLYRHETTGAQVLFILNDDPDRAFSIAFRTPSSDDSGVSHVLEHAVLYGSEKYPSYTLYHNLTAQTYNTFLNAYTYPGLTIYQASSLSEEQLLRYADHHTDSCFHPLVLTDQTIFDRQAWHYTLEDAEADLGVTGVVYSELLGSLSQSEDTHDLLLRTLYPGSVCGNSYGGTPEALLDLTREELCAYHAEWYRPSNCLVCIYGSIAHPEEFLSLLDGCFSSCTTKPAAETDPLYTPLTSPAQAEESYALSAADDAGEMIEYGFVCSGLSAEDLYSMDLIAMLFDCTESTFCQEMRAKMPWATAECRFDAYLPEPCVYFSCMNARPGDEALFREIVDSAIAAAAKDGFADDSVEATASDYRLSVLLIGETSGLGLDLGLTFSRPWAFLDDTMLAADYFTSWEKLTDLQADGTYLRLIRTCLQDNPRAAFAVTKGEPGLIEKNETALADRLREKKDAMSADEAEALIAETAALMLAPEEDSAEYVRQLTAVTVETLPEEIREYEITEETDWNGVCTVFVRTDTEDIGVCSISLDCSSYCRQDQLYWLEMYTHLIGNMDTSRHTAAELAVLGARYLPGLEINLRSYDAVTCPDTGEPRLYLEMRFLAGRETMRESCDLLYEMLYETDFSDTDALAGLLSRHKSRVYTDIVSTPLPLMIERIAANASPTGALNGYLHGTGYHAFLMDAETMLSGDPQQFLRKLRIIPKSVICLSSNAVVTFAGDDLTGQAFREAYPSFLSHLEYGSIYPETYTFEPVPAREALIIPGAVQYNLVFADTKQLGLDCDLTDLAALEPVTQLVADRFLTPYLREYQGAYSAQAGVTADGLYLATYRDPNIAATYDYLSSLPELIGTMEVDQETLNGYILSVYSSYAAPSGELNGACGAIYSRLMGLDPELGLKCMQALKRVTPETVHESAALFAKLIENGMRSTAGNVNSVYAAREYFDTVLDPFRITPFTAGVSDVGEDSPLYGAVMFMLEYDLMDLREGAFLPNEPVTLGAWTDTIYHAFFDGAASTQRAMQTLRDYGIGSVRLSGTKITRAQFAQWARRLYELLDVPLSEDAVLPDLPDADTLSEKDAAVWAQLLDLGALRTRDGLLAPDDCVTRGDMAYMLYILLCG